MTYNDADRLAAEARWRTPDRSMEERVAELESRMETLWGRFLDGLT